MKPLTRSKAWVCALTNALATPGLGTLVARRWLAGAIELLLALAGFLLIGYWIFQIYAALFRQEDTLAAASEHAAAAKGGVVILGLAWILSLISSIRILRSAPPDLPKQ